MYVEDRRLPGGIPHLMLNTLIVSGFKDFVPTWHA
jgi:hypothetical protein